MKIILALMLLISTLMFGQGLDKLEQIYLNKAERLQKDHDARAKANDNKLTKDSQRLAEAYLKALRIMLIVETKKGDFDKAVKVKAKITEIEALINIGGVSKTRPIKVGKAIENKIKVVGELTKFNGIWEITGGNETIIYEIKNNEVWHNYIKRGSVSYSTPQKVKYIIVNGILGMQHIAWEDGKPLQNKHNWIDLKNNRSMHTFHKDPSKMHGSYRKLTKLAKKNHSVDLVVGKWKRLRGDLTYTFNADGSLSNTNGHKGHWIRKTDGTISLNWGKDWILGHQVSKDGKYLLVGTRKVAKRVDSIDPQNSSKTNPRN